MNGNYTKLLVGTQYITPTPLKDSLESGILPEILPCHILFCRKSVFDGVQIRRSCLKIHVDRIINLFLFRGIKLISKAAKENKECWIFDSSICTIWRRKKILITVYNMMCELSVLFLQLMKLPEEVIGSKLSPKLQSCIE